MIKDQMLWLTNLINKYFIDTKNWNQNVEREGCTVVGWLVFYWDVFAYLKFDGNNASQKKLGEGNKKLET